MKKTCLYLLGIMTHESCNRSSSSWFLRGTIFLAALSTMLSAGFAEAHDYTYFIKDGCCRVWIDHCTPDGREGHPNAACRDGHLISKITSQCTLDNLGCCTTLCPGYVSYCAPDIPTGSVQELPNGIDDDCDGYTDDEQCDGVDNDGNGIIDDSPNSCLLKVLFVPLAWEGGVQSDFESAARTQWDTMRDSLNLWTCDDNFLHRYLSVQNDNIAEPGCTTSCGIDQVRNAFMARADAQTLRREYDVIAFITNRNICNDTAGCSDGNQFIWVETDYHEVLAHEIGHLRALEDEYCSNRAGSTDERCNDGGIPSDYNGDTRVPPADLNILSSTLGCDPRDDEGCCGASTFNWLGFGHSDCADVNYGICCEGNKNDYDGRCVMTYADAENPRIFCANCKGHLLNDWITRTAFNPATQTNDTITLPPLSCAYKHQGSGPVIYIDYTVNEAGQVSISRSFSGKGRLGLKSYEGQGRYGIEIRNRAGAMLFQSSDNISFDYEGPVRFGVNYSGITYASVARSISVPVQNVETGPVKITGLKDGVITSQTCLASTGSLPNGAVNLAVDQTPPTIQCPNSTALECSEHNGVPANSTLLAPFFNGIRAADSCDPAPIVTNNAPAFFSLGTSSVTFTAADVNNNTSTCSSKVTVVDTTPPAVSCPQSIIIECSAAGGTPSSDPQLAAFFSGFRPADICDAGLALTNNAPPLFGVGSTTVTFTAADHSGNTASCQATVMVVDTTRPVLSVNLTPNILWPPDHKMVPITPEIHVSDICDTTLSVSLASIAASEDGDTRGDGHTSNDIQIDGGGISLRAERSGTGDGRTYTLTYTVADTAGNSTSTSSTVTVPHNK